MRRLNDKMAEGIVKLKDWTKLNLIVAKIIEVEDIKGADKLYKITLNIGSGERTICAGLKEYYGKEELDGKVIIYFENLAPRMMKGVESQGMLLAAESEKGEVVLISPEKEIEIGSRVG